MSKHVTYDLLSHERADFVVNSLLFAMDEGAGAEVDGSRVKLTPRQVRLLAALSEDDDGHIDTDGRMWIGGTEFLLAPSDHEGNAREVRDYVWQAWCSCGFEGDEHGTGNRADDSAANIEALSDLDRHHTRAVDLWLADAPGRKGRGPYLGTAGPEGRRTVLPETDLPTGRQPVLLDPYDQEG